jgi:hypothetical protein
LTAESFVFVAYDTQVTDVELDQIAKMGLRPDLLAGGSDATAALLGNYQEMATPLATPMRTPKRVENVVEQEARNLLRLTQYVSERPGALFLKWSEPRA